MNLILPTPICWVALYSLPWGVCFFQFWYFFFFVAFSFFMKSNILYTGHENSIPGSVWCVIFLPNNAILWHILNNLYLWCWCKIRWWIDRGADWVVLSQPLSPETASLLLPDLIRLPTTRLNKYKYIPLLNKYKYSTRLNKYRCRCISQIQTQIQSWT